MREDVREMRDRLDAMVARERLMWRKRVELEAAKREAWEAYDAGRGSHRQVENAVAMVLRAGTWESEAVTARGQVWAEMVEVLTLEERAAEFARWWAVLDAPLDASDCLQGPGQEAQR